MQNCDTNRLCGRGGVTGPRIKVNQNLAAMDRRCNTVWDKGMGIPNVLLSTLKDAHRGFLQNTCNKQDKLQQQSERPQSKYFKKLIT